ncbi:MAG: 50S ribosomal protein L21 [Acidobacteria bacterium]|mgnify:CR=1 FL=1|nr:MAG: 50S ribosomal protein L21 [Acidobacteriota bacterium]REK00541.1 MAG: 50S ribosomal protein L21 [Acidobacteriota bacterium]
MFAVIETGGKQYRVEEGDLLDVERLPGDLEAGSNFEFDRVLMVGGSGEPKLGTPLVDGAKVEASLVDAVRGKKIIVFKKKRRKGYRRTRGHRQDLHRVRIDSISA